MDDSLNDLNQSEYNPEGYNPEGSEPQGYNPQGSDAQGYNPQEYNPQGSNPQGYNSQGYNPQGYYQPGYEQSGYGYSNYNQGYSSVPEQKSSNTKAVISLMSQYTPVPFKEAEENLKKRLDSLSMIENRLVSKQEDYDLKDLIDAFDFDFLFYQDLTDDTQWLPDFNRVQPFSNALAKPVWHWKNSFDV